jgi:hypothetical protein
MESDTCASLDTVPNIEIQESKTYRVEQAAKLLSEWLGYDWDGLGDRDISAEWPDWTYGFNGRSLQGGKPAVRRMAARVLDATTTAPIDHWRDMTTAPVEDDKAVEHEWFLARVRQEFRLGNAPVLFVRRVEINGSECFVAAEAREGVYLVPETFDGWKPLPI